LTKADSVTFFPDTLLLKTRMSVVQTRVARTEQEFAFK